MRSRDFPAGTDGGRMAGTNKPRSASRPARSIARSRRPTITGMIWLCSAPTFHPSARRAFAGPKRRRPAAASVARALLRRSQRFDGRGRIGRRRSGGKDIAAGSIASQSMSCAAAGDKSARATKCLAERADPNQARRVISSSASANAAAALAEHARGMCFVDHQHGTYRSPRAAKSPTAPGLHPY